jgi:hypothetical protein
LNRGVSNGARATRDEDSLADERARAELRWSVLCDGERSVRRGRRDADAGADFVASGFRKQKDALGWDNGEFLRGSACRPPVSSECDPDPIANVEAGHTGADVVDDAGAVVIWNGRFGQAAAGRGA